jgi:hypothetical protein
MCGRPFVVRDVRPPLPHVLVLLGVSFGLSLLAPGCGDRAPVAATQPARSTRSGSRVDPYRAGLAYAACMRAHGVPHPDPDTDGNFKLTPAQDQEFRRVGHARVEAATRTCFHDLRPVVSTQPLSERVKVQAARVLDQLRSCLRRSGYEVGAPVVRNLSLGRTFFGFRSAAAPPSKEQMSAEHMCERSLHFAQRIDAIVALDRAPY